jgi:hypothetical protein
MKKPITLYRRKYKCNCGKKMTIDFLPGMNVNQIDYALNLVRQKQCPECYKAVVQ